MANRGGLEEKFLTTRFTGERDLGCGPPEDFDNAEGQAFIA